MKRLNKKIVCILYSIVLIGINVFGFAIFSNYRMTDKIFHKRASCIIKMWMLKIENTSEYNKTTDWQVSKNLIIQRGIYNEV